MSDLVSCDLDLDFIMYIYIYPFKPAMRTNAHNTVVYPYHGVCVKLGGTIHPHMIKRARCGVSSQAEFEVHVFDCHAAMFGSIKLG